MNEARNIAKKWQEDEALRRFKLISPLLQEGLDEAKRIQLREHIAAENGISTRTLYRYEKYWRENEFQGLKPCDRKKHRRQDLPENFEELLAQAIQLKREVPKRSVMQIIAILELERRVAPGVLKRSTLERHLYQAGYGRKQLLMYCEARESSSKRFCKPHRMMLIQADIKYGPKLPIGKNGAFVQTYLSSAIDDHSRYILASRFYDHQEETIVEDTFHQAIDRFGRFDSCYVDNGSQYVAKQLRFSLARLGIPVRFAPLRSGKSKGKVERFHQVVDAFLREVKLQKVKNLEELNRYWEIFLEEYYHKLPHDGIKEYYESLGVTIPPEGISPMQEWSRDSRALTYLDRDVVAEAFLHHEKRRVDKGACISFRGQRYETKPSLIGFVVEISYDPIAPEKITVRYPGIVPFTAQPVKIGAFCDRMPTLPVSMQAQEADSSRLLDALEKKHKESGQRKADAISYADLMREVRDNV
ncbi:MAG: transposase family protein [Lachnospiraceae bacterium]|nr:transposase family protein [Lachnospiraceae bacterium]